MMRIQWKFNLIFKDLTAFIGYSGQKWYKNLRNLSIKNNSEIPPKNPLDNVEKIYDNLHLVETQVLIRNENRHKAGVYKIFNKITGNYYIGSAITNRINKRLRNHLFHGTGSTITKRAIDKYGICNFKFVILEYYPGIILKDNLKKEHLFLLERETYWIRQLNPSYNILNTAIPGPNNYRHSLETKEKMRANFSDARREFIKNLNLNKIISEDIRNKLRESSLARYKKDPSLLERMAKLNSKPVTLQDSNGVILQHFPGVRALAKHLKCCHKTVNKAIQNNQRLLKNLYRVIYTNDQPDR